MILVLETNGALLYLFQSTTEVESQLEAMDVENGEYEFCDDSGQRFLGEIVLPVTKFRAGSFHLKANGPPNKEIVTSFLSRARSLDKSCEGVHNLDDLRRRIG